MKKLFSTLLLFVFLCCSLSAKEIQIIIFSTNDMHGSIDNFAKIASYIQKERTKNPNILVLSGGDMFSGNPVVDQYPQKGFPMIELMNKIGYQYEIFGNHEFDYGQEVLSQRIEQANFKFLCANMIVDENVAKIKQPQPYDFLQIGDTKICILSVIEVSKRSSGELLPATHPARLKGITFTEPVSTALKYKSLRNQCDVFIGLTHTGYSTDREIAEAMPELDVIIGGHSHTRIDSTTIVNGVLISQAQSNLHYLGKTTITLDGNKVKDKKFELINIAKLKEEDAEIKQLAQKFREDCHLDQVIAHATGQFNGKEPLGSLMTDAVTNIHGLDFAFQNAGGVRIGQIAKGAITMADIYQLDPFGNTVVVFQMTPAEIRSLLMNSYRKASKRADLLVSGMTYTIHTRNGKAVKVTMKDLNGNPLDENKRYKVGMNSYISSSYRFDHADSGHETTATASDALIKYLKQQKEIAPQRPRTSIVEE